MSQRQSKFEAEAPCQLHEEAVEGADLQAMEMIDERSQQPDASVAAERGALQLPREFGDLSA